jgi:hypothetical protein
MLQFSQDCPFLIALYVFSLSRLIMKVQITDCVRRTLYIEMTTSSLENVPFLAGVSELSILDCPFWLIPLCFLSLSFNHESSNVAFESTNIYITIGKGRI